jgi:hypothetical protein
MAREGDDMAAQEGGPLQGTGTPNRTGRDAATGRASVLASQAQRGLTLLAFAAAADAVVLGGAPRSVSALLLGTAGLSIVCAAAWRFLGNCGMRPSPRIH